MTNKTAAQTPETTTDNMQARHDTARRIRLLTYAFTVEYTKDLDAKAKEENAVKELETDPTRDLRCMVMVGEHNAKVTLSSIGDCINAVNILTNPDEDVDDWMLTGINAILDKVSKDDGISYDLPLAINGLLLAQYR